MFQFLFAIFEEEGEELQLLTIFCQYSSIKDKIISSRI